MNFFILTQENRNVDLSFNELIAFSYILPALVFGTVAGMIQARVAQKDFNKRVTPTQGLRECRVIALLLGLAGGLGGILFGFIVTFPLSPALAEVRLIVFTVSILLGVTAGLSWGGIGLLQHYVLRFLLFKSQVFPFPFSNKKLIESLDFFVQCSLLQRVGGGWRFIHRDLQEYLASIAPDNPKDAAAVWDQEIAGMELPAAVLSLERKRQSGSAKTVVELDLVGYSSICALLEEAGDVNGVATLNSKIQEFVDAGLKSVEAKRSDSVIKTTGDGAILLLDSPQYAHRFAEAIHELTRKHNSDRSQPVGKRVFRIGVATGDIALEPLKGGGYEIAGMTIARAVRLESKASPGGILVDSKSFDGLHPEQQIRYSAPESVAGKRDEIFKAHGCVFDPDAMVNVAWFLEQKQKSEEVTSIQPASSGVEREERREILERFKQLDSSQVTDLVFLLNIPIDSRPPNTLDVEDRKREILEWAEKQNCLEDLLVELRQMQKS